MDQASRKAIEMVMTVMSCFELQKRWVKERCDALGVNCLKYKEGVGKVIVDKHKSI